MTARAVVKRQSYSWRNREDAALICAIKASSWRGEHYERIVGAIGASRRAMGLAYYAYFAVWSAATEPHEWAEAEALIRTGWVP